MSKAGRQSLYRYQAHSLLDATGRCAGTPARKSAHDAELSELPCPICLDWFPLEELEEDHAPQRKNQSNLGGPHLMALTCTTCNRGAGRSYEMTVKNENDVLAQPPAPLCRVHERWGVTEVGTFVERDVVARRLVDLKSAFLIVFATLGYRWAASPRLDRIRQVLRGRTDIMFIADDYDVICGCSTAGFESFMVYDVASPASAILVTGAHAGILLPGHHSERKIAGTLVQELGGGYRRISGTVGMTLPWPTNYNGSKPVEQVWRDLHGGTIFHIGRCTRPDHHRTHAMTEAELDERLQPADHLASGINHSPR